MVRILLDKTLWKVDFFGKYFNFGRGLNTSDGTDVTFSTSADADVRVLTSADADVNKLFQIYKKRPNI